MPSPLNYKEQLLLEYLNKHLFMNGKFPSLREAALDLDVSHMTVAYRIKALEAKGFAQRCGRYNRDLQLTCTAPISTQTKQWREVPVVGQVKAGLPMYAQQEWAGSLVLDSEVYRGQNLFALRIQGDSMKDAGMLDKDLAICEPRQYAKDGEIVVALIHGEEATVKRFFLHPDHIELRPENTSFEPMRYNFDEVLIQGKVIGILRGTDAMGDL